MKIKELGEVLVALFIYIVLPISIVAGIFAILPAYLESRAFNKCTGGHATIVAALFTDLRVQNCNH